MVAEKLTVDNIGRYLIDRYKRPYACADCAFIDHCSNSNNRVACVEVWWMMRRIGLLEEEKESVIVDEIEIQ